MHDITFREIGSLLRKYWGIMLFFPLLGFFICSYYVYKVEIPQYEASTTVLVHMPASSNQMPGEGYLAQASSAIIPTIAQLARSTAAQQSVINSLKLNLTTKQLGNMIQESYDLNGEAIQFTVYAPNEPMAAAIANDLVSVIQSRCEASFGFNAIQVLDPALSTPFSTPISPRKKLDYVSTLIVTLIFSMFGVLTVNSLDKRVKDVDEIIKLGTFPVLGVIILSKNR